MNHPLELPHNPSARAPRAARLTGILVAAFLLHLLLCGCPEPGRSPSQAAPPAQAPAAAAKPAEYVGSETCQACHEDIFKAFQKNPHHLVETDKKYGQPRPAKRAMARAASTPSR